MNRAVAYRKFLCGGRNIRSGNKALNEVMGSPKRGVEAAAKIATRPPSDPDMAADLLPRSDRQRKKSSPRKSGRIQRVTDNPPTLSRCKSEGPLKTLDVIGPDFRIDDAWRPLAIERVKHLLGGYPRHVLPRLPGHPRGMRARQHIVELQQRMVGRRRLLGPDVKSGAGNALVAQRLEQRRPRRG